MTQKTKARIALTAFLAACMIPSAGVVLLPPGAGGAYQAPAPAARPLLEGGSLNTHAVSSSHPTPSAKA